MPPRYLNLHGYNQEMTRQTRDELNPWSETWLERSHKMSCHCQKIMGEVAYRTWMAGLPDEVDDYDFKAWTNIFTNKLNFELTKLF